MESCTFILENGKLMSTQENQSTSVHYSFTFHNQNIEKNKTKQISSILNEWLNTCWYIHTMKYCSTIKMNELFWMLIAPFFTLIGLVFTQLCTCARLQKTTHTHINWHTQISILNNDIWIRSEDCTNANCPVLIMYSFMQLYINL